jgi:hypothetical protein
MGETESERAKAKVVEEVKGHDGIERPAERKVVQRRDAMREEGVWREAEKLGVVWIVVVKETSRRKEVRNAGLPLLSSSQLPSARLSQRVSCKSSKGSSSEIRGASHTLSQSVLGLHSDVARNGKETHPLMDCFFFLLSP